MANLKENISVKSYDIKANGEVKPSDVDNSDKEKELKDQLSEEDMQKLQEEFKKEAERLQDKYQIVEPELAENIVLEDVTPEEAKAIMDDREDLYAFTEMMDGLGLSASQLGIGKKYFVARDMSVEGNPFKIYFNPKYFMDGSTRITFKEGCLTYPGVQVPVKRYKNITFHWYGFDEKGEWKKFQKKVKGLNAIILQHEVDHCGNYPGGTNKPRTIMMFGKGKYIKE
jgi:peptide deformylase